MSDLLLRGGHIRHSAAIVRFRTHWLQICDIFRCIYAPTEYALDRMRSEEREFRQRLARKMRDARKACWGNQSQAEFARLLKVKRSQVTRWESGESLPRLPHLLRYAERCNTTAEALLKGFGRRPTIEQLPLGLDLDPKARAVVVHLVDLLRERPSSQARRSGRG